MSIARRTFPLLSLAFVLVSLLAQDRNVIVAEQPQDRLVIARITITTDDEMSRVVTMGLDLLEHREGDDLFILTTPRQVEELTSQGLRIRIDEPQTATLDRVNAFTYSGGYSTVPEMRATLEARAAQHPDLAEFFIYGSSWQKLNGQDGHDLFGIRLTNTAIPGPKPTLFLMAAIHARELSVSELALRLVDHLLTGYGIDADATWLLDEHQIVIVPVVNPDGRRLAEQGYYQRKNMNPTNGGNCSVPPTITNQHGIDLNRNFNFKWGTVNTPSEPRCGQTYPGPVAESEPETQAVEELVRSLFPDQRGPGDFDAAPLTTTGLLLTLHSYGDLVLWPWGFSGNAAPNSADLSLIGRKFAGYNGFTPQQSIQLYPTSGTTDDWSYGELGVPSFTFEVGLSSGFCGGFMPPYGCLDGEINGSFWPRNLPAFLYASRIARAPYRLVRGPTVESLSAELSGNHTIVQAIVDEQRNGGQRIAAAELYLDTPPWRGGTPIPMNPLDGAFNGVVETAIVSIDPAGHRMAYVRGQDETGNWGPVRAVFLTSAPALVSLTFNPADVVGGSSSTGKITLDVAAPSGGALISLASSSPGTVIVPASVTIPEGLTSRTFAAKTSAVGSITDVEIMASYQDASVAGTLRVLPPSLKKLSLTTSSFVGPCQSAVGKITLTGKAPGGGVHVTLSSANPAISVPPSVLVPAGRNSASFTISGPAVDTSTTGQVRAVATDPAFGTNVLSKNVTILANRPAALTVPSPITGPATVTASVTLTCAAGASGQLVLLSSSNPAVAEVQDNAGNPISNVAIPAGQTSATFRLRVADVGAPTSVKVRATANGVTKKVTLSVN